jgi:hypothetical protein
MALGFDIWRCSGFVFVKVRGEQMGRLADGRIPQDGFYVNRVTLRYLLGNSGGIWDI